MASPRPSFDMKHADQVEQPPRGVEIHVDLAVQGFPQQLGRVVVKCAAGHVDRLDPVRAVGADRFEIAVANGEIVADRPKEAGEAEANGTARPATFTLAVDGTHSGIAPHQALARSTVTPG